MNCNNSQKLELDKIQLKILQIKKNTQTVTKCNNSNCDKTQKLKFLSKKQFLPKFFRSEQHDTSTTDEM